MKGNVHPAITFFIGLAILWFLFYSIMPRIGDGRRSRIVAAQFDINDRIKSALEQFRMDSGFYPKGNDGLVELVQHSSSATNWHGPYVKFVLSDPWGNKFFYECPGKHNTNAYDLLSAGPDGRLGTEDDIGNWTK